jgi:hypothetical protein
VTVQCKRIVEADQRRVRPPYSGHSMQAGHSRPHSGGIGYVVKAKNAKGYLLPVAGRSLEFRRKTVRYIVFTISEKRWKQLKRNVQRKEVHLLATSADARYNMAASYILCQQLLQLKLCSCTTMWYLNTDAVLAHKCHAYHNKTINMPVKWKKLNLLNRFDRT